MVESPSPPTVLDALISVAAHLEGELEEALAESRLSRPSYLLLDALADAPGGALGQRELIGRLRRTAGTVSLRLSRLEKAGLVTRATVPGDRRAATVTITDAGRDLLAAARPLYEARAARLCEALPAKARREVDRHLQAWLRFLEPGDDDAPRLGIAVATAATAARMRRDVGLPDEPGVLVLRVHAGGPAAAAGLARGDLITHAAGRDVRTIADLERAIRGGTPSVTLRLVRGVEPREAEVRLG